MKSEFTKRLNVLIVENSQADCKILHSMLSKSEYGVFDIQTCDTCGGPVKVIASIEDSDVIHAILSHRGEMSGKDETQPPLPHGPPGLFD